MDNNRLVITKHFPNVAPGKVYAAWTDPAIIAQWYGPEGFSNTIHEMDVRPGGKYRLTMTSPDGGKSPLRGSFRELKKPEKIVFTWQWEGDGTPDNMGSQETVVTVIIRAAGKGSEMTMTHEGFATAEQAANHNMGWTSSFSKIEKVLAA